MWAYGRSPGGFAGSRPGHAGFRGGLPVCPLCGELVDACACVCPFCSERDACRCCIGYGLALGGD